MEFSAGSLLGPGLLLRLRPLHTPAVQLLLGGVVGIGLALKGHHPGGLGPANPPAFTRCPVCFCVYENTVCVQKSGAMDRWQVAHGKGNPRHRRIGSLFRFTLVSRNKPGQDTARGCNGQNCGNPVLKKAVGKHGVH